MNDAIDNSKKCQKLIDSTTDQCNCWANQSVLVQKIKKFSCLAKATQKLVTKHKENCKDVFKVCKKEEDASVEAVYSCMNDHSMGFINQSLDSLGNSDTPTVFRNNFIFLALAAVDGAKAASRLRDFHLFSF